MMKNILLFSILFLISLFSYTQEEWKVPEEFIALENPYESGKSSLAIGKSLYSQHCKSCHGKLGAGDGPASKSLSYPCPDFHEEAIVLASDGSLFYKISQGRKEMPAFENLIPDDEDRWHIINYIRELQRKSN